MGKQLIIIPTHTEAEPFIQKTKAIQTDKNLYLLSNNTHIFICGAGMPAAILNCSLHLTEHQYSKIILAGIAGSFKQDIKIGETVNVKSETFADLGYFENDKLGNFFSLKDWKKDYNKGIIENPNTDLLNTCHLRQVSSNSVNLCNIQINGVPDADIENMEGAGLFLLFIRLNLPFLEIRSISNHVRNRNKQTWDIPLALENLSNELINNLCKKTPNTSLCSF